MRRDLADAPLPGRPVPNRAGALLPVPGQGGTARGLPGGRVRGERDRGRAVAAAASGGRAREPQPVTAARVAGWKSRTTRPRPVMLPVRTGRCRLDHAPAPGFPPRPSPGGRWAPGRPRRGEGEGGSCAAEELDHAEQGRWPFRRLALLLSMLVFLYDRLWNAAALADLDAMVLSPGPDACALVTIGHCAPAPAVTASGYWCCLAGVRDVWLQGATDLLAVSGAHVDLI